MEALRIVCPVQLYLDLKGSRKHIKRHVPHGDRRCKKKDPAEAFKLAQEEEIQQLMGGFSAHPPTGQAVQELEGLVRTAIFKPATDLIAFMLQAAADRIDAAYQPKPGEARKGRVCIKVQCLFGTFTMQRDYYYHPGKECWHYPADVGLMGLPRP